MAVRGSRVTQSDVARLAGVSQTTVSLVLNSRGTEHHRVGDLVRERVLRAIEETGYAANPHAQRLAGGVTSIIGVYTYESVFPHDIGNFYHPFLAGAEHAAERAEVDLLMFTSMSAGSGRRLLSSGIGRLRVADGCILLGRHSHAADLAELVRQNFPFAFVGRRESAAGLVPYAGADYAEATRALVRMLLDLGHRSVAMASEYAGIESLEDRITGYRQAMTDAGLPLQFLTQPSLSSGEIIDQLLASGTTAVVATSDLAFSLRRACRIRGLRLPEDLSIARLGDPEQPIHDEPGWTGFTIPRHEMGEEAVRIVLRQLDPDADNSSLQVKIPCAQQTGRTVGPPPTQP